MGKHFSENNGWGKGAIAYLESLSSHPDETRPGEQPMNPHEISDEDYLEAIAETLTEWNSEAGDRAYQNL